MNKTPSEAEQLAGRRYAQNMALTRYLHAYAPRQNTEQDVEQRRMLYNALVKRTGWIAQQANVPSQARKVFRAQEPTTVPLEEAVEAEVSV